MNFQSLIRGVLRPLVEVQAEKISPDALAAKIDAYLNGYLHPAHRDSPSQMA
jgi:hypothetical protein